MKKKQFNLHSFFLQKIKKNVKASFVAFEEYNSRFHIKVIKDKKPTLFQLVGTPNQATFQSYSEVLNQISNYYGVEI